MYDFDMLLNEIAAKKEKKEDNTREIIVCYKAGEEENPVIVKSTDNKDDSYVLAYVIGKMLSDSTGVNKDDAASAVVKAMIKVMTDKIMEELLK